MPASENTSTLKKSMAASAPRCARMNVFQGMRLLRSGAGSTVVEKDALDGIAVDLVAEIAERVAQPCVAPAWIVSRELDDQFLNRRRRRWPAGSAFGGAIVFSSDELAIPTQDRIRRHEAGKVAEHLAAERIAAHR